MGHFKCCMNCEKRHPMCHDRCAEYLQQRELLRKEKEAAKEHYTLSANEFNRNAYAFNRRHKHW